MKLMISIGVWLALLTWYSIGTALAAEETRITHLKKLYLDTVLVKGQKPQTIIVAPSGSRYEEAIGVIQEAILRHTGVKLPVVRDEAQTGKPEEILRTQNAIALGNMVTNPFAERMYRQWYVLLDLRYPGPKGHVVRSLHNPYGTGHNVIWLGGSDDEGVLSAARVFANGLKAEEPGNLKVGWLMDIKLGEGVTPPGIGDTVYSWRDSFRRRPDGKSTGYGPSTYFGWNPISAAGALYYMTGQKEYLDYFKSMAMPDPGNIPVPNRTDDAFNDPINPLVLNYHYRAHLVDCVYDLIEESPLFTDEERLFITSKLLDHQRLAIWGEKLDPWSVSDSFRSHHGSRHSMWHMLCIYTGSRYFDKYYPHPRWKKRMQNVRESFESFIDDPTWGELDTLGWVSTSTEPVFEFFMLDGFEKFVSSGTARTMISAMETLWTNVQFDESNGSLPISLLHKAAYMMKDGRYIWLRDRLGFDFSQFRIGQSFWPAPDMKIKPPKDIAGKISTFALPRTNWQRTGKTIPLGEGFQFLAYRAGLTPEDDLIQIDGFYGKARTPYHVNSLYTLRMFGGKRIFHRAYANQVTIRSNGMVEPVVPRAAALKRAVALHDAVYIHVNVPNMAFSAWDRHLIYIPGNYTIALDEVTPRQTGDFDITVQWAPQGTPVQDREDPRQSICPNGPVIQCASPMQITHARNSVTQTYSGHLREGEAQTVSNIIYWSGPRVRGDQNKLDFTIDPVDPRANVIRGTHDAFVAVGGFAPDELSTDAEMAYLSTSRIFLVGATRLACGDVEIVRCDKPISLSWQLDRNQVTVEANQDCRLVLASAVRAADVAEGTHTLTDVALSDEAARVVSATLNALKGHIKAPAAVRTTELEEAAWEPIWVSELSDSITHLAAARRPDAVFAGTSGQKVILLDREGKIHKSIKCDAEILSMLLYEPPPRTRGDAMLLVGLKDDQLLSLDLQGDERWRVKAEVDPSYKIGDRYQAPWFTDPGRGHTGVLSLLVADVTGQGQPEIVLGRPATAEYRKLNGELIKRIRVEYGDCSSLAFLSRLPESDRNGPRVLAGKFYTGQERPSIIDRHRNTITKDGYGAVPPGHTNMDAWMQRGISHLQVSDLDGDGIEEVIIVRSGHWNDVRVYDGSSQECLWGRYFGPGMKLSHFMTGLVVSDLTGDGRKEIVVGMRNGWACAFDHTGKPIWQHHFPSAVTAMCKTDRPSRVAVGCADGFTFLTDGAGWIIRTAKLSSSVTALSGGREYLLAGTKAGKVARFELSR